MGVERAIKEIRKIKDFIFPIVIPALILSLWGYEYMTDNIFLLSETND